jgi:hypothetical protein
VHIQWRYLDIQHQSNTGLWDIRLSIPGLRHWALRVYLDVPTTVTSQLSPLFVTKSLFRARHIVHPEGGGATRLVCESCGAEYPYVAAPQPCANCAVMKESGIMVVLFHRTWQWSWSDWGWAIKENGYYVGEPLKHPMPPGVTVARFKTTQRARKYLESAWRKASDVPVNYEIVPYPIKPVQPVRPDPAIMASIFGPPGIGARPGRLGQAGAGKGLPK